MFLVPCAVCTVTSPAYSCRVRPWRHNINEDYTNNVNTINHYELLWRRCAEYFLYLPFTMKSQLSRFRVRVPPRPRASYSSTVVRLQWVKEPRPMTTPSMIFHTKSLDPVTFWARKRKHRNNIVNIVTRDDTRVVRFLQRRCADGGCRSIQGDS